ncbi:hypothetical protein SCA6_003761 [Theobroma cacao]
MHGISISAWHPFCSLHDPKSISPHCITSKRRKWAIQLKWKSSAKPCQDERHFERWNDDAIKILKAEFKHFKDAVVFSLLHPWEKHACLLKKALKKGPQQYGVIIEIACTKPSEELLRVRKVYHSLFEGSSEEDLAAHIKGSECKVYLKAELFLKETIECLCTSHTYFTKVLDIALRIDVNEDAKKTLTRLIITQEARNLKGVITKYAFKIKKRVKGAYKNVLTRVLAKGEVNEQV